MALPSDALPSGKQSQSLNKTVLSLRLLGYSQWILSHAQAWGHTTMSNVHEENWRTLENQRKLRKFCSTNTNTNAAATSFQNKRSVPALSNHFLLPSGGTAYLQQEQLKNYGKNNNKQNNNDDKNNLNFTF